MLTFVAQSAAIKKGARTGCLCYRNVLYVVSRETILKFVPRVLEILMPLALVMLLMGVLLGWLAFFGDSPWGPVNQGIFDNRWWLVADGFFGFLLLVARFVFKPKF